MMKGDAITAYLARNRKVTPEAADALRVLLGLDTDSRSGSSTSTTGGCSCTATSASRCRRACARDRGDRRGAALDDRPRRLRDDHRFVIGTAIGAVIGWRRGSRLDALIPITTFLSTIPYFWLGLIVDRRCSR